MLLETMFVLALSAGSENADSVPRVIRLSAGSRFVASAGDAPAVVEINGVRTTFPPDAVIEFVPESADVPIYLELDGVYFSVPAGTSFEYVPGSWVVPATSMTNCARRNNQVQEYSNFSLLYGPNLGIVYLSTAEASSSYYCVGNASDEACVLAMQSTTGDIVCSGAVAAPDPIFANSFDGR